MDKAIIEHALAFHKATNSLKRLTSFSTNQIILGPTPRIGVDNLDNSLKISTVKIDENRFETAILNIDEIYVMDVYTSEAEAKKGHSRWVSKMSNWDFNKEIKIYYSSKSFVPDETIKFKTNTKKESRYV